MSDNLAPPPTPTDHVEASLVVAPRPRSGFSWFLSLLGIMFVLGSIALNFILLIVVMIFGAKRIPEIMGGVGKGIKTFKRSIEMDDDAPAAASGTDGSATASADKIKPIEPK